MHYLIRVDGCMYSSGGSGRCSVLFLPAFGTLCFNCPPDPRWPHTWPHTWPTDPVAPSTPCPAAGPSGPSTPPPRHRNDGWHVGVADPPINSIPILGTHWVAGVKKWRETQTRPSNQNLGGPGLQDRGHRRRAPARVDSVHARILEKKVGSGPARPDSPSREADRADRADTRRSHFTN